MIVSKRNKKTIYPSTKPRGHFKLDSAQDWKYMGNNNAYGMKCEVHNTHVTKDYFILDKGNPAGTILEDV